MSKVFLVEGGMPLSGIAQVPAAKNSVLPLLAASLLCEEPICFLGVPALSDIEIALAILNTVGFETYWQKDQVNICPQPLTNCCLPAYLTEKMRASVLFLAPMLTQFGMVETGMSGGCRIGERPIDIHLDGLVKMGARVCYGKDSFKINTPQRLCAVDYTLRYPSVGATETLIMAAVKARGITVLRGVACEPEIVDLAEFLNKCGAKIVGAGSNVICITGVTALSGGRFRPLPDRIVAATIACATAAAQGEVYITQCKPMHFSPVLDTLRRAGCEVELCKDSVLVACHQTLAGVGHLSTGVYPGFPTDAAPLIAAALLCAKSQSYIEDSVFEHRFSCATGFEAMGANIAVRDRTISIDACDKLCGTKVFAPDLRGGAALVIAALAAQGMSEIGSVSYISRGYANFAKMLSEIGAKITEKNT